MMINMMVTVIDSFEHYFLDMCLIRAQISNLLGQIVLNTNLEMNKSIIFILMYNYMHILATFLNKKFERLRDPFVVF